MDFDFEILRVEGIVLCLNVMIIVLFCFLDFVLFLVVLVNSVLPRGLRHLTQDIKSDVSCLQISLTLCIEKTPKDSWSWPSYNVNCKRLKEIIDILL